MSLLENNFMQGFAPADEVLLFRQKDPKPFLPVRVPAGAWSTTPNHDGCATRSEVQSHLSAQTVLAEGSIRGNGPAAPNALDGFNIPQFEMITVHSVSLGPPIFRVVIPDVLYRKSRPSVAWESTR